MFAKADARSAAVSELLLGETFEVIDIDRGFAWGRSGRDGYVGHVAADQLSPADRVPIPTHRLVGDALCFDRPDLKSAVTGRLPFNALVSASSVSDRWWSVGDAFVNDRWLTPASATGGNAVDAATAFIGAPYRWGGRTREGVDCSGLIQAICHAVGRDCPRDADQQQAALGDVVDTDRTRARGDIVFFPGHVGMMVDGTRLLHANAHWMSTVVEPLADVVARLLVNHPRPIAAVRRLTACLS